MIERQREVHIDKIKIKNNLIMRLNSIVQYAIGHNVVKKKDT